MKFKKLFKWILFLSICLSLFSIPDLKAWTTSPPQWVQDLPAIGLLPDPLRKSDGTIITNSADWPAQKTYLIGQIKQCITGTFPSIPTVSGSASFNSGSSSYASLSVGGVSIGITLYFPSGSSSNKYPAIIFTWVGTGQAGTAPGLGCIGVSVGTGEIGSLSGAFPGYSWGDLMKRAWIAGAVAKWLKNQSWVDSRYIATSGHSRGAKVAYAAAALFDDITGGAPNCGGTGGENPFRYAVNEYNTETTVPGGFVGSLYGSVLSNFHGRENKLPVDLNTWAAVAAPKPMILGTAVNDILGGPWGIMQSYHSAKRVYDLLGVSNKIGVRMDWGGHHYDSTAVNAYVQFLNLAWGRTSTPPTDPYVNLFRHSYTFAKWKTDHPTQTLNPSDYSTHPMDMSDILKDEYGTTIDTTLVWEQKKERLKQEISNFIGGGPADSSFTSANTNFGGAHDGTINSENYKPIPYSTLGRQNIFVKNSSGNKILNSYLCYPTDRSTYPVLIFINNTAHCNGFSPNGSTQELMWPLLNELVVNRKVAVLGYDVLWTGLRIEEGQNFYTRYSTWTTMGKNIEDVKYIVSALLDSSQNSRSGAVDRQKIYSFGYGVSGGAIALLSALYDDRISGVVTMAGVTPLRTATLAIEGVRAFSHLHGLIPKLGFFVNDDLNQNDTNKNRIPFDFNEVVASIAPRPVAVVTPRYAINVLVDQVSSMVTNSKQVYTLYNKNGNLNHTITEMYNAIDRWEEGYATNNTAIGSAVVNLGSIWDGLELKCSLSVASLPPDGTSTTVINAEVRDRYGKRTSYTGTMNFAITSGSSSGIITNNNSTNYSTSISNGGATATIKSTTTSGKIIVTVTVTGSNMNRYTVAIPVASPDGTAPSVVNNLSTTNPAYNSITLTWTATGDDGTTGTATSYDIRYMAGTSITSSNWDSATPCTGEPTPKAAGGSESFAVNGLNSNTQYYFAMKVSDEGGNTSGLSNVANDTTLTPPADPTAPSAVANLAAGSPTSTAITLTWTATGDDGTTGTATSYDIRYMAGTSITSSNWDSATPCTGEPTPKANGGSESYTVNGLSSNTQYYFGIKVGDEIPNWSNISNIANATTLQAVTNDPVGEWKFEENTGTTASDTSGNSNSGTLSGTAVPNWVQGRVGNALQFDGLGSYVAVPDSDSLDCTTALSIEAWVKTDVVTGDGVTRRIVDKGSAYALAASEQIYFKLYTNGAARGIGYTWSSSDIGVWHHIVGTYDAAGGNNNVKLYQDGQLVGQMTTTGNLDATTSILNIGRQGSTSGRFDGIIDELRIYNRALTSSEVTDHYNGNIPPSDSTAPAQVTTLATSNATTTSMTLSWIAVGDDGTTGTAASYDIRYNTITITSGNWATSTQCTGEPNPAIVGSAETYIVSTLNSDTTYYFAMKIADEIPNQSIISNIAIGKTEPLVIADITQPNTVGDLTVSNQSATSITLTWTAVGDDGTTGTATSYDIRYLTYTITTSNWAIANQVINEPASPQAAGNIETCIVGNLTSNTTYYFAMKVADEVPNISGISNVVTAKTQAVVVPDTTAPSAITNLTTSNPTTTSLILNWSAVGDDGTTGTATSYDIRYQTYTITSNNFSQAVVVSGITSPKSSGNNESFTVNNLNSDTTYYFAIKVADEIPNTSGISNITSGKTEAIPQVADITAPSDITNLTAGNSTTTGLTLSWSSVGDDGVTGTATTYDIRYMANILINSGNWDSATQCTGEPMPQSSGNNESYSVSNLIPDTTYYFAIKVGDDSNNWSGLSNIISGKTNATATGTSPVAEWNFNEGSGTTIQDGSGNNNTGTLMNEPLWVSGRSGTGLEFDGTNTYISVNDNDTLDAITGLTLEAWVKTDVITTDGGPTRRIIEKGVYSLSASDQAYFRVVIGGTGIGVGYPWNSSYIGQWHHLVGTYDSSIGASNLKLYQDGQLVAQTTAVGNLDINTSYLNIGRQGSTSGRFDGVIDEIKIYNRAISASEVLQHYQGSTPPQDTTAPSGINELTASNIYISSITLTWTATGDDGNVGTATSYDIRYMVGTALSASNWGSATQVTGEPSPKAAGNSETYTLTNLIGNTSYYIGIKVIDDADNTSAISNIILSRTLSDNTPPGDINTLAVLNITSTTLTIKWTSVGDDNTIGTANSYDIRYNTVSITSGNWATSTQCTGEPAPQQAGEIEMYTISNLIQDTTYYIGLKVADEVPNTSGLSNIIIGKTLKGPANDTPLNQITYLTAASLPNRQIQLSWLYNPTNSVSDIGSYNIYMASGSNNINYYTPYLVVSGTVTTVILSNLIADKEYKFVVRTTDINGNEDANTEIISVSAIEEYSNTMLSITSLTSGMKVSGKQLTITAESIVGNTSEIASVQFEYRKAGDTRWIKIPTTIENTNPDTTSPYFVKWDVSNLDSNYNYNIRTVSIDKNGIESSSGYITISIDNDDPDINETATTKSMKLDNRKQNIIKIGIPDSNLVAQVVISSGILNGTTSKIRIEINPVDAPTITENLVLIGYIFKIEIDGQSDFTEDIEITLPYKDADNDNRIDDKDITSTKLLVYTYGSTSSKWEKVTTTTIDRTNKVMITKTRHLSFYGIFAVLQSDLNLVHMYPNPFKPSVGHTKIFFNNLTNHTKIKIFNIAGELIYEDEKDTPAGELSWDVKNGSGEPIASGVYIYIITNNIGQTKRGKLAIIR